MAGNQITFGVGFNVNEQNLNKLKQSLKEIQQMSAKDLMGTGNFQNLKQAETELKKIKQSVSEVQGALNRAFNASLGTTNITKFNTELQKLNLEQIATQFNAAGAAGQVAFNNLATSVMTSNVKLKQTYSLLENMKTTLTNTIKWNIASSAINAFTGSVSSAFNYVKALDASLTDIRIVTGDSREEMAKFAVEANNAAQALGRQTKEYTNAALAFYQQGLNDREVQARTEASLKAQNVTGAGTEIVDDLTAVWNGFQVTTENTEKYVDKLAAVADSSASNLSELATAMSKVASTANNMGVDMDQLTAQISTIIATTRQAPETVGNALKTIYARINDIKTGSDEAEISLGNYTGRMASLGISVLDANGRLRDTGSVMEEIGGRWQSMTREQQIYLAQTMAGQRQMNNLIALFDNWQQYSDMLNVSLNAEGALNEKNARYMESLSAHLNQFKAATEGLQDTIIDEEAIKSVVDAGTDLVNLFNSLLISMGGIKTAGIALGGVLLQTFSSNIASGITNFILNLQNAKENVSQLENELAIIRRFKDADINGTVNQIADWSNRANVLQNQGVISSEERAGLNQLIQEYNELQGKLIIWDEAKEKALNYFNALEGHGNNISDIANKGTKSFEDQSRVLDDQKKKLEDLNSALEAQERLVQRTKEQYNQASKNVEKVALMEKAEASSQKLWDQLAKNLEDMQGAVANPEKWGLDKNSPIITELKGMIEEFEDELTDLDAPQDYAERQIQAYKRLILAAQQTNSEVRETFQNGARGAANDWADAVESIRSQIENKLKADELRAQIQNIIGALGSIAGTLGGFRAVGNAFKTLENDSLSASEKFTQFTQAFAMGLSMIILNAQKLTTSISKAIISLKTFAAAQEISAIKAKLAAGEITKEAAAEAIANAIRTKSIKEVTIAIQGEIVALYQWAAAWLVAHPAIAAVLAITVAATVAIVTVTKAINAETEAAKKAAKQASEAKSQYNDLRQVYEELKSSLEDYKNAQDAIDALTIGTQEWRDAIAEANQQVLELLSNYPELSKYMTNQNGRLIISEEGINAVMQTATSRMNFAQNASFSLNNAANKANLNAESTRVARQIGIDRASLERGIKIRQDLIDQGTKPDEAILTQALQEVGITNQNLIDALANNDTQLESLAVKIQDTTKSAEIINQQIAHNANIATGNKNYLDSEYQSDIDRIIEAKVSNREIGTLYRRNMQRDKTVHQAYAEQMGYTYAGNGRGVGKFINQSGQEITVDDVIIRKALALNDALNEVSGSLQQYVDAFNKILQNVSTDVEKEALASFAGGQIGDLSELTTEQLKGFEKNGSAREALLAQAENLGWDSASSLEAALNTALENYNNILQNITQDMNKATLDAFNSVVQDKDLSPAAQQAIANVLKSAFHANKMEGLTQMEEVFDQAGEKAGKLAQVLDGVSKDTTPKELAEMLSVAGISIEDFGVSVMDLVHVLNLSATEGFAKITEAYSKVKDIVDGLEFGDGISPEDAELIKDMGINLSDFFMMGADGTQILIGKAEELQAAIDKIHMSNLYNEMMAAGTEANRLADIINNMFTEDNAGSALTGEVNALGVQTYDASQLESQLNVLEALEQYQHLNLEIVTSDQLDNWRQALEDGEQTVDMINEIGAVYDAHQDQRNALLQDQQALTQEWQNSAEALASFRLKLDEDIDTESWQSLTQHLSENAEQIEGLSDELKTNKIAAAQVAESILRFDDAIQDVTDHYDDWIDALSKGTLQDKAEAFEQMRDAYSDLLNLDGDSLSETFLESTKNLELMRQAIEGDEQAYNDLMAAVREDIISQVSIQPNFDLTGFEEGLNQVQAELDAMNYQELEIGANLDTGNFIAACEQMINAAGMTADQATDYLASMGVDAQVVETSDPVTETHETGGYTAQAVEVPLPYSIPFGNGFGVGTSTGAGSVTVPYYTPQTEAFTTTDEKKAVSLKVTSANKSSGGGFKHTNASNGGGGKGKKSGGGGGGGSKKKDPLKPMKAKIDPYHDVNIKIGDTQEGLEKLQKERDKLIGKDAVDNLAKQINLMEREKELLQEKAKIAEGERQRQAEELAALGAIFEKNGDIANYKDLLLNKQNQVNAAIAQANKLEGDERDAYEKYVKDLEQEYKDLESAIKEYDDTQQLLDDLGLDYQDLINEQIEKAIEAFDLEINVKLDLKDAEKEFNDFKKKVIDKVADDNYAGQAASTAALYQSYYNVDKNGVSGGIIKDLREHATQIQNEIALIQGGGFSQIYGDDLAAAADDLKKYNDELMDALEEAQDVIDDTHDHFLDAIDAMQDAFDAQQENLDKIDDLLSHDMEILQLIHGEENFDEMDRLWGQQIAQDTQRLQALQEQQQYWQDRLNDYEKDTDEWKKAMENWQAAFEATNDAMIQSVQNLQSKWENSINSIMTQLRNQTFGGNMDAALEDWDKMTWHSERYLDSIDRANGLLDLQKSYIDMINKTNDPKVQAKLAELEEKQLDALANKEHLREIDLKLAQQQLTVLQAQMALEDAQQAKTKLRLRRDSQGNYTYQYVADEDNIQEKTQEYLKALNEYRTMANDSLHQDLEDLRDYTLEYYEKLQDAQMKYGDDTEALLAEQNRLYEMYFGDPDGYINALHNDALSSMTDAQEAMFTNLYGLNQSMEDDLFTKFLGPDSEVVQASKDLLAAGGEIPSLLDAFVNDSAATAFANINQMTQDALSGPHGLLPEWSSALWNIADQYDNDFVPRVYDAMTALQGYNQEYVNGLAVMQEAANRTTENIALGLAYDTAYTNALNDASAELIDTQKAQVEASEEVYNALKKNEEAFADQTAAAIDAANAMYLYWLALNGQGASSLPYSVNGKTGVNVTSPKVTSTSSSSSYTSSPSSSSGSGGSGSGSSNSSNAAKGNNYTASVPVVGGRINPYTNVKYATGGLNNQSGLAWLDGTANEPEIVLNPGDTKNILDSVNIVRTIFDRVQSVAGSAAAGLSSGSALDIVSAAGQTVLQDVVIHADFPGVEDASQIKQAFNELINLASQRASGNRRTY